MEMTEPIASRLIERNRETEPLEVGHLDMNQILLIAVVCGGTFGFMIFMRRRLHTQYAHMRAGELATRLGLTLREGNPEHNLVTMSVQPQVNNQGSAKGFLTQMAATQVGGTLGEFKLHATGQPYGVDAELFLYCRQDYKRGIVENVTTTWHDLRLTVHARCAIAPFDLRLRKETAHLETRRDECAQPMPPQSFGDPTLDQRYVIESFDPMMPRRIAAALAVLPPSAIYLHVTGSGNQISFVMTPATVSVAMHGIEQVMHALAQIASIAEGRPLPVAA